MPNLPMVIGHRGASGCAPENTFAAFDRALELGCAEFEFDVRQCKDGAAVVIHDATVDRTTGAQGVVAESTLAELQALDAGSWYGPAFAGQRIPSLAGLFERYAGRAKLWVELKEPNLEGALISLVERHGLQGRTAALAFDQAVVQTLAAQGAGRLHLGWLTEHPPADAVKQAVALGAQGIYAHVQGVTPELVEAAAARGLVVGAWGVETEAEVAHAARCGVSAVIHNFPDQAQAQLRRLASAEELRHV